MQMIRIAVIAGTFYFLGRSTNIQLQLTTFSVSAIALLFGYSIYTYLTKNRAKLIYAKTEQNSRVIDNCPTIRSRKYQPPFLFQESFIQLLAFTLFVGLKPALSFRRESIIDPAGEVEGIFLSWPSDNRKRKIKRDDVLVFILPGLTGGEVDSYIHELVDGLYDAGYQSVIYNYRLLSQDVTFDKINGKHVNLTTDLRIAFTELAKKHSNYKHIYAIGHSYGANQLVNYLGTYPEAPIVKAGASIANPYCMISSSRFIRGTIYDWFLARLLANKVKLLQEQFSKIPLAWGINLQKAMEAKTLYDFDNNFTSKVYGYPTVDAYYRNFGSVNQILNVSVPLFCLSANDDTIAVHQGLPRDEALANPNIILMETDKGSHVVWLEGNNPFNMKAWFPKPVIEFIDHFINEVE